LRCALPCNGHGRPRIVELARHKSVSSQRCHSFKVPPAYTKPYPGKCARRLIRFSRQTPELSWPVIKCAFNRIKLEGNV
jgi:hypothetical protein